MRKFQIKFIEMHIVNIDGDEKEIVAYQTATTNEVSKKQIISNYYSEDNQEFLDRLEFENVEYPNYPNLVTTILDAHSRAIVFVEEIGDIKIDTDEVVKFINENKSKILSEERMVFTDFENKGFHIVVFPNKFSKTDDNERHFAYLYGIDSDNISTNFQDEKKCINISKLLQQ